MEDLWGGGEGRKPTKARLLGGSAIGSIGGHGSLGEPKVDWSKTGKQILFLSILTNCCCPSPSEDWIYSVETLNRSGFGLGHISTRHTSQG